ncbi:hypothetical protein AVEN_202440-1 [Araneus ventricosus]|uniref:Uncharacterized protein n=1 Tax=Araneus ventricosus TaxID=182803 RepID=A0A4Y2LGI0_ARAVE|nr:hypothetical protein AVEN_101748-1 [Araneus ventricosus]GBM59281.1 hypothetical protein AVEN_140618-1 [Araneus ventricosus]GBN12636.1 hypothetical protein AVEN_191488-1 [Araneus ventricosus]GBN12696.1 hypothetical protein AVEN_202440-1 [Araneus ventricosus]
MLYEFYVNYLAVKLSWPFKRDYQTNCRVLPTSWLVQMTFQRVTVSGEVSIPIVLRRIDSIDSPVGAYIRVAITDDDGQTTFLGPRSFGRRRMLPGDEVQENLAGILSLPQIRASFNEEIFVSVVISVVHCHSDTTDSATSLGNDENRVLCSKM